MILDGCKIERPSEESVTEGLPAKACPIELVTENGYSIRRRWEIDQVPPPAGSNYHFLVRNPQNFERQVTVEIAEELVLQIELRTGQRILVSNSFWICCAERHLATCLWENDAYPAADRLCISQLDPEDLMSAIRWKGN